MTSVSSNQYSSLFAGSAVPNWLANTMVAIQNQASEGGLLGMLDSAGGDGSVSSFLGSSVKTANAFALISQNSLTSPSLAANSSPEPARCSAKRLEEAFTSLTATQQMVQPTNVLDPVIYFPDGSTIDTNSNILTMANGTQIDTTTGTKVIDTSSIMQLANGAYLDTQNNIMTMPDGTQIDTVTGLTISVTA